MYTQPQWKGRKPFTPLARSQQKIESWRNYEISVNAAIWDKFQRDTVSKSKGSLNDVTKCTGKHSIYLETINLVCVCVCIWFPSVPGKERPSLRQGLLQGFPVRVPPIQITAEQKRCACPHPVHAHTVSLTPTASCPGVMGRRNSSGQRKGSSDHLQVIPTVPVSSSQPLLVTSGLGVGKELTSLWISYCWEQMRNCAFWRKGPNFFRLKLLKFIIHESQV